MAAGDDAQENPPSQRWEWGPRPADPPRSGLPSLPPPPPPEYVAWTPQPPPPPPMPPRSSRPGGPSARRGPLVAGAVAAVVGGACVAGWFVLSGQGDDGKDAAPAPSVSASGAPEPSAPPASAAPPTRSDGPSAGASPSASAGGYSVVRNEAGFSVAVPEGWERSHDETGSGSFYRLPGDRSALLQIFRVGESASTGACELLRLSSQTLDDANPGYRQVSLEPVDGSACELVYEYDSAASHGRRRGVERIVTTPGGERWALLAAGPATDAETVRAHLTAALESFRPE
ncbi:hypothetical protein ABZZ17_01710 [Streptomyces sp. NPDC006512]|uniref:hypothetical protein n=1 Tax=Streptomyces sp. NPDC006512 TaxID=3154307 RepID=UPI0033A14A0B